MRQPFLYLRRMKILILEPYFTGSHSAWANEYVEASSHEVSILSLQGRFWKWRMHGGAVSLARRFNESDIRPDLILATDMLDLTTFLALTRHRTSGIPCVLYFHENQLTYPWSPRDEDPRLQRDNHYSFINYASALAADAVYFSSNYQYESFFTTLPRFLKSFPDRHELSSVEMIKEKSEILPLGMDLKQLEKFKVKRRDKGQPPLILWNHRWEYDKGPEAFFKSLFKLQNAGFEFEVAICGQRFGQYPAIFDQAKAFLGSKIVQWGYLEDFTSFAKWLWEADILPITAIQDFFGVSVVQALYCNTYPILPNRLAYPEHIPLDLHDEYFYHKEEKLYHHLSRAISLVEDIRKEETQNFVKQYDWENLAPVYDEKFANLVK